MKWQPWANGASQAARSALNRPQASTVVRTYARRLRRSRSRADFRHIPPAGVAGAPRARCGDTSCGGACQQLAPGEQVALLGCAYTECTRGDAWVHGHRLRAGEEGVLLRSLPDVGSTVVLEGGALGAELVLRAPADSGGTSLARLLPFAEAAAAGHATLVTQV